MSKEEGRLYSHGKLVLTRDETLSRIKEAVEGEVHCGMGMDATREFINALFHVHWTAGYQLDSAAVERAVDDRKIQIQQAMDTGATTVAILSDDSANAALSDLMYNYDHSAATATIGSRFSPRRDQLLDDAAMLLQYLENMGVFIEDATPEMLVDDYMQRVFGF